MYKDQQQQKQQRHKAWESTIRKTQLQRLGCSIFAPMSVAPFDDSDTLGGSATPTSSSAAASDDADDNDRARVVEEEEEPHHVERLLPNGDFYTGLWAGDCPHGAGKYLWTDGCMYEGEWSHGKTMGKGKFSWPSGATYEGEFKSGFLDGFGTFTGASGDTYRGQYSMNLKHGRGNRTYPNRDYYDGDWRAGLQEGQGRYIWEGGHEYSGTWKAGSIHGKGVMLWANGNRYEGEWEDGAPCGKGQFRWADGSLYVGIWAKDPNIRKGVYFPSSSSSSPGNLPRDPHDDIEADLYQCKVCPGESVSILPSQKAVSWSSGNPVAAAAPPNVKWRASADAIRKSSGYHSNAGSGAGAGAPATADNGGGGFNKKLLVWGSDGDITCDIVNGDLLGLHAAPGLHHVNEAQPKARKNQAVKWASGEMKKQGVTISKGHKNFELMLNLQLGIRHSVGKHPPPTSLDLKASAFDPKEKVWTKFPPEGTKHTPPHQSCDFRWKDYCPAVFRTLRKLFKVDPADYMISICGNDALRELSSPGKSGSFFYLTNDDRYMIKTMKKSEVKVISCF